MVDTLCSRVETEEQRVRQQNFSHIVWNTEISWLAGFIVIVLQDDISTKSVNSLQKVQVFCEGAYCDKTESFVECMEQKLGWRKTLISGPADSKSRWQLMLSVHSTLTLPILIKVAMFRLAT